MIRDITIGQYYPADSRIHKLDPRVKIVCTLLYLISLFTFKSILGYVLATVFLFGCIKLAKVPFKIHCQRTEANYHSASDHSMFQLISDTGRKDTGPCGLYQDHGVRLKHSGLYGDPADLSDYGILTYDTDNYTEFTDRWSGEASSPIE